MNVKLNTATVRWVGHPDSNKTSTSYNVSLKSGNQLHEIIRIYNKSSVTFLNMTMRRTYTVKIESFTKRGDLVVGSFLLYSPGNLYIFC